MNSRILSETRVNLVYFVTLNLHIHSQIFKTNWRLQSPGWCPEQNPEKQTSLRSSEQTNLLPFRCCPQGRSWWSSGREDRWGWDRWRSSTIQSQSCQDKKDDLLSPWRPSSSGRGTWGGTSWAWLPGCKGISTAPLSGSKTPLQITTFLVYSKTE